MLAGLDLRTLLCFALRRPTQALAGEELLEVVAGQANLWLGLGLAKPDWPDGVVGVFEDELGLSFLGLRCFDPGSGFLLSGLIQ